MTSSEESSLGPQSVSNCRRVHGAITSSSDSIWFESEPLHHVSQSDLDVMCL
jgi:hypothetical protein